MYVNAQVGICIEDTIIKKKKEMRKTDNERSVSKSWERAWADRNGSGYNTRQNRNVGAALQSNQEELWEKTEKRNPNEFEEFLEERRFWCLSYWHQELPKRDQFSIFFLFFLKTYHQNSEIKNSWLSNSSNISNQNTKFSVSSVFKSMLNQIGCAIHFYQWASSLQLERLKWLSLSDEFQEIWDRSSSKRYALWISKRAMDNC